MYNPLMYDGLEQAGETGAKLLWRLAELATLYGSPFAIYAGYKAASYGASYGASVVRWAFSCGAAPAPAPAPAAPVPQRSGWIMRGVKSVLNLASSVVKFNWWWLRKVLAIAGLARLSGWIHENYLRVGLWQNYSGVGVAFLRPLVEKIIPYLAYVLENENYTLSLRSFVFGSYTREEKILPIRALYSIRDTFGCTFGNYCASFMEQQAYALGQNTADTIEAMGSLTKDIIVGTTQLGSCAYEIGANRDWQCYNDGLDYVVEKCQVIYDMSAPVRAALNDFAVAAWGWGEIALTKASELSATALATSITYAQQGATFALGYGDQLLWNVAASVEESTGIPPAITHGAEVCVLAAAGLFTAYKTAQFAYNWAIPEAARSFVSRLWTRPNAHDVRVGALPAVGGP